MFNRSSLRVRLVGTVFLAIAPACLLIYLARGMFPGSAVYLPWNGLVVGFLALVAAWLGGERYVMKQLRALARVARRLREGDFSARTGLEKENSEIGQLANSIDEMAVSLEQRSSEREKSEKMLLNRAFQQTVVGALGQFAMVSNDLQALLNQAVMLAAQTLEVEHCGVLELSPDARFMMLRAGIGWKDGLVGKATIPADPYTQTGFTLTAGEPVVVENIRTEPRFGGSPLLNEHGVISGVTVLISGHGKTFGILGVHSARRRKYDEDEVHFLLAVSTVLAMAVERQLAEQELRKLAAFTQLNPNPAMEVTPDGNVTYFNEAALHLSRALGAEYPKAILPENIFEIVLSCLTNRQSRLWHETQIASRTLSWSFHPVSASNVVHAYVEDITDRLNLEAQFRQAQKMESVGQLAAGVAHDFNNMLTVIQGHSGLLLAKSSLPAELREPAQAIYFAAERAAGLTRQLLMFSRKNVMQVKLLDLRDVVSNMLKMLQRLIGEPVTLQFQPPARIPLIQGDVGMLEQVLMNLAVNARDAMPKGGFLSIALGFVQIDSLLLQSHPLGRPGPFLCLRVSDTGCGMDSLTLSRIFEPFFTTKEVGKGTGLGLATVYGIVKQHEGWIEVASQPGRGTAFTLFFPARSEPVEAQKQDEAPALEVRGGKETILVVEDEPVLRDMAHVILEDCGYRVLEAGSGVEAINVWNRHGGAIDLVLTDMVMPEGLSGMDLAQKLLPVKPDLKIVFASGYSMDDIDTNILRDGRAAFLQKPYTHVSLTKAVRECLDH